MKVYATDATMNAIFVGKNKVVLQNVGFQPSKLIRT